MKIKNIFIFCLFLFILVEYTIIAYSENVSKLIVNLGPKINLEILFTNCTNTTKIYKYFNNNLKHYETINIEKIENNTCRIFITYNWNKSLFIYNISPILNFSKGNIQYLINSPIYLKIEKLYPNEGYINTSHIYIKVSLNIVVVLLSLIISFFVPVFFSIFIIYYIKNKTKNLEVYSYEKKIKLISKINKLFAIYFIIFFCLFFVSLALLDFPDFIVFVTNTNRFLIFILTLVWMFLMIFFPIIYSIKYTAKLYGKEKVTKNEYILSTIELIGFVLTYLIIFLIIFFIPKSVKSAINVLPIPLQILIFMFLGFSVSYIIFSFTTEVVLKKLEQQVDPWIVEIVNELSKQLKIKSFKKIRVIETIGGKFANAMVKGIINKELILTKQLIKLLNKEELKAVIVHELAHSKYKHIQLIVILYFIFAIILFSGMNYIIKIFTKVYYKNKLLIKYSSTIGVGLFALTYILLIIIIRYFQRRAEEYADLLAAKVIDSKTYIKALAKLSIINLYPIKDNNIDIFSTHPSIFKRLIKISKRFNIPEEELQKIIQEAYLEVYKNEQKQ